MRLVLILISALMLVASPVQAETPTTKAATIGVGDRLAVTTSDLFAPNVDTITDQRVDENGVISLPLIGKLTAAGRSEGELERDVADAYARARIIEKAQVIVKILPPTVTTKPASDSTDINRPRSTTTLNPTTQPTP